jgi:hypothetical protein
MREHLKEKLSKLHWMKEVISSVTSCLSNAKESGACDITDKHSYYNVVVIISLFLPQFFQPVDIIRSILHLSACSFHFLLYCSVNYIICGVCSYFIISSLPLWSSMCAAVFLIVIEHRCETDSFSIHCSFVIAFRPRGVYVLHGLSCQPSGRCSNTPRFP